MTTKKKDSQSDEKKTDNPNAAEEIKAAEETKAAEIKKIQDAAIEDYKKKELEKAENAKAAKEAAAAEEAKAAKVKPPFYVMPGKAITTKKGIISGEDKNPEMKAEYLAGGQDGIDHFVKLGYIGKGGN